MVEIVFETHSTSTDNEAGIATGWRQGRLSETGRRQARELGDRRRQDGIAAVFTSDLQRAVETAEIAFVGSGIPVHQDSRLRECDYGELNGMPVSRLEVERPGHIDDPFPGGQSYRQVVEQTRDLLSELATGWDGQRVLLVSHSANRWALDCLLGGARLEELVGMPFGWQEGWEYRLPAGWTG
jgi:alpha-ribazole phosphatase/probable phosphoglycerate mutase